MHVLEETCAQLAASAVCGAARGFHLQTEIFGLFVFKNGRVVDL